MSGDPLLGVEARFGSLTVNDNLEPAECFNDGTTGWRQFPRLTAREVVMINLMDQITDLENWEVHVFDDNKVAGWRENARVKPPLISIELKLFQGWGEKRISGLPLISDQMWAWCIMELRGKSVGIRNRGLVRSLDAGSCVCKSDSLVSSALKAELRLATEPLRRQYEAQLGDRRQIVDIVDPSLFLCIYGKTPVLTDGRLVGRGNCVESCGDKSAITIPPPSAKQSDTNRLRENGDLWSLQFSWLLCELKFPQAQGNPSITSYINNLHPMNHERLYGIIEEIMTPVISLWNDCIFKGKTGPAPIRIRTSGYEEEDLNDYEKHLLQIDEFLDLPDNHNNKGVYWMPEWLRQEILNRDRETGKTFDGYLELLSLVDKKSEYLYTAIHPEPGAAFSYEDWKVGRNGRSIIPSTDIEAGKKLPSIKPDPDDGLYRVDLQDSFEAQGLQIIVRIRDIDLTTTQSTFSDDFTMEAQRNEYIVATAAYIYSMENITPPRISFRQPCSMHEYDYDFKIDKMAETAKIYSTMGSVFAFTQSAAAEQKLEDTFDDRCFLPGFQVLGSVSLRLGRLIAWPNTLWHRIDPISTVDPERPGHLRMLLVYLVDPNYRIVSTANVPPQQHDWWADAALNKGVFAAPGAGKLPMEIKEMVERATDEWPMGMAEALRVKADVERDRAKAQAAAEEGLSGYTYDPDHWD